MEELTEAERKIIDDHAQAMTDFHNEMLYGGMVSRENRATGAILLDARRAVMEYTKGQYDKIIQAKPEAVIKYQQELTRQRYKSRLHIVEQPPTDRGTNQRRADDDYENWERFYDSHDDGDAAFRSYVSIILWAILVVVVVSLGFYAF